MNFSTSSAIGLTEVDSKNKPIGIATTVDLKLGGFLKINPAIDFLMTYNPEYVKSDDPVLAGFIMALTGQLPYALFGKASLAIGTLKRLKAITYTEFDYGLDFELGIKGKIENKLFEKQIAKKTNFYFVGPIPVSQVTTIKLKFDLSAAGAGIASYSFKNEKDIVLGFDLQRTSLTDNDIKWYNQVDSRNTSNIAGRVEIELTAGIKLVVETEIYVIGVIGPQCEGGYFIEGKYKKWTSTSSPLPGWLLSVDGGVIGSGSLDLSFFHYDAPTWKIFKSDEIKFNLVNFYTSPYQVEIVDGNNQTGLKGQSLPKPIKVQVKDSNGKLVPSFLPPVPVYFGAKDNTGFNGSVSNSSVLTTDAVATTNWSLANLLGEQKLYAFLKSETGIQTGVAATVIAIANDALPGSTITDIEGNVYNTVTIGSQVWMVENLKTTKYNDGTSIPNVTDNTAWGNLATPGYCWYNNDPSSYKNTYGALYNWFTVNTGKLAPTGWHIPTDAEWTTLTTYLGGESLAGGKLKETGTTHWSTPNTGATNETGFTALSGGWRDGASGSFASIGNYGAWMTSTFKTNPWNFFPCMSYNLSGVTSVSGGKQNGFSVRCLKDSPAVFPTVSTTAVSNIAQATTTSGGNITDDGGAAITARGVCWNTSANPTISNSKTTDGTGTGSFTSSLTGLTASTTYYVRAYATNSIGTSYGSQVSFTTSVQAQLPTLTTTAASAISTTSATSGGSITSDGGAAVTARGVCWSTSQTPTTANSKTTDGTGTGGFTSSITGLVASTTYYVRAYATNSVGTSYGTQMNFTTTAPGSKAVTAGQLSTILTSTEQSTITKLTLTGSIDARDFKMMRDNMPLLAELDLSGATVVAYTGGEGTHPYSTSYPANAIPGYAFCRQDANNYLFGKTSLTSIILPLSITSIEDNAFAICTGLTSFTIPSSVRTIGQSAFYKCSSLITMFIPYLVNSIGYQAFQLSNISITVDVNNQYFSSIDGVLFNKAQSTINYCPATKTGTYIIPSSVTYIGSYAFGACSKLTSVSMPSSVTKIGQSSFELCSGLTSFIIPSSVTQIESAAFQFCSGLTSIYTYNATPIDLASYQYVFRYVHVSTCTLHVPSGSKTAYQTANQWMDFTNIVESANTITDLDGNNYSTVTIGKQVWVAENLKTTKYNDGTAIPLVTDGAAWAALSTPGYCWYNNDAATYKATYGALYNWYTVNTGKLCPTGWHVPSDAEWTTLETYLGENVAGGKLKETGTTHWHSPNTGATNDSGFTALPGSNRDIGGAFYDIGNNGYWWSSTELSTGGAWYRAMTYYSSDVFRGYYDYSRAGDSVRCLRDN